MHHIQKPLSNKQVTSQIILSEIRWFFLVENRRRVAWNTGMKYTPTAAAEVYSSCDIANKFLPSLTF